MDLFSPVSKNASSFKPGVLVRRRDTSPTDTRENQRGVVSTRKGMKVLQVRANHSTYLTLLPSCGDSVNDTSAEVHFNNAYLQETVLTIY